MTNPASEARRCQHEWEAWAHKDNVGFVMFTNIACKKCRYVMPWIEVVNRLAAHDALVAYVREIDKHKYAPDAVLPLRIVEAWQALPDWVRREIEARTKIQT